VKQFSNWCGVMALLLNLALAASAAAPTAAEKRAFDAAVRAFADGFYERAERELGEFTAANPQSDLAPRAVLLQAQAKSKFKDYTGAVALLNSRLAAAGSLLDEYRFWLAEAQFQLGDLKAAAAGFESVVAGFPKSSRRLDAAYREALARFKIGETTRAIELLRDPKGAFQTAAKSQILSEPVVRGALLLAEALAQQKDFPGALKALAPLGERALSPELAWLRQYWLTRVNFESGDAELAVASVAELARLATASGSREFQAETHALQGNILQELGQFDVAAAAFEHNLSGDLPGERRRQALLKIIEISLAQNQSASTVQWLERFLKEHPQDASLDVVRLTLAEVKLKQYFTLPPDAEAGARSNLLAEARTQLDRFVADFAQSPFRGKAQLNRGLVFWEDGRLAEAGAAFQMAVERLAVSEEQAIARFKLADVLFQQKDFRGAVSNYQAVVQGYENFPRVRESFFDQAWYQIIRASIELGDLDTASGAVAKILAWYPDSFFSDRSLLLLGQALNRRGQPAQARAVFLDFLRRFPDSKLASEVHLAIARTYVQDQDWTAGLGKLDEWISRNPGHPSRPQAEFDRAWLTARAKQETNSLARFKDFIERFPTNAYAPVAQNWIADHYQRAGDFLNAEKNYQLLFQNTNWPVSKLTYSARLMAGRSAVARQAYKDARDYFASVFTDEQAPPGLAAEALLLWGDAMKEEPVSDPAKSVAKFSDAIDAFRRITQKFPTDPLVPAAFGSIANCYLQLAAQDPKRYDDALEAYRRAREHPAAGVALRSQAEVGLGMVFEKQAQLKTGPERAEPNRLALDHYLNVVYGKVLKDGETADVFWVKEGGLRAAALLETQQRWDEAVKLYERLRELVPPLRPVLEKKLERARARGVDTAAQ
jgi:TolA-binding protein